MKFFIFSVFILNSIWLSAQPGDMTRPLHIRIFTPKGDLISNETTHYAVKFQTKAQWGNSKTLDLLAADIKFKGRFEVELVYGDYLIMTIQNKKSLMTITTQGSIDSIVFTEGNFTFDIYQSFLFSFYPGKEQKISNWKLSDFIDPEFKGPLFTLEESEYNSENHQGGCHKYAEKIELKHGGNNWADNSCNDEWQPPTITEKESINEWVDSLINLRSNDIRIMVYPLEKTKLIKHEFFLKDRYWHKISLSDDEGKSWTEIMRVMDEWYVNLVYFPEEEKIGIDVANSGVVLISDYNLKEWKYFTSYPYMDDQDPPVGKEIGLVLRNENWMDSYFGRFYFSE